MLTPIKNTVMKKYILVLLVGFISLTGFAHQTETSTIVLAEKENNVWVLQISASLTAFQQEIKTHFSETPYKTPEEFQEMVLQHIQNNLHMHFNGNDHVTLSNGIVQLGHETNVVFEVIGIPVDINTVEITNTVFKDIYKNKSTLMVLKEDFTKTQFVLNNANDHRIFLTVSSNEFVRLVVNKASFLSSNTLFIVIGLLGLGFLILNLYNKRTKSVSTSS